MLNRQAQLLENAFFHKRDAELLENLRRKEAEQSKMKTLAFVSGITDERVLKQLVAHNIHAESLVAFSLIPILEVVWADGEVQPDERAVILRAAEEKGLKSDSPGYKLLDRWLQQPPEPKLLRLWEEYAKVLVGELTPEAQESLKQTIMQKAYRAAEAAGGFLGFNRITDKEEEMLKQLERAFKI
jgi:hypothetical protein